MRGEYNQEVQRRILDDGPENTRNLEPTRPRPSRQENNHQEREGI